MPGLDRPRGFSPNCGRKQSGRQMMAERFAGRTAVITGGASGIGAGIATRLSAEGASLSLWDVDEAGPAKSNAAHSVTLDVTDPEAVHRAAASTVDALGKIDILV